MRAGRGGPLHQRFEFRTRDAPGFGSSRAWPKGQRQRATSTSAPTPSGLQARRRPHLPLWLSPNKEDENRHTRGPGRGGLVLLPLSPALSPLVPRREREKYAI